jgi:hypothetical protein
MRSQSKSPDQTNTSLARFSDATPSVPAPPPLRFSPCPCLLRVISLSRPRRCGHRRGGVLARAQLPTAEGGEVVPAGSRAAPAVAEPHGRGVVGGAGQSLGARGARPLRERSTGRHPGRVLVRAVAAGRRCLRQPAGRRAPRVAQPAARVAQRVPQPLQLRHRDGRARRARRALEQDPGGAAGAAAADEVDTARHVQERDAGGGSPPTCRR